MRVPWKSNILLVVIGLSAASLLPAVPAAAETWDVDIQGFAFSPNAPTIPLGDSLRWTNRDSAPHTVTFDRVPEDAQVQGSGTLGNGESFTYTPQVAGDYHYYCSIHPSMTGSFVVEAPNAPPNVTIDAPQDGVQVAGTVTFQGSATDPEGSILTAEWWIDDTDPAPLTLGASGGWQVEWDSTTVSNGTHAFHVRAEDDLGAGTQASLSIEVANAPPDPDPGNRAPVINLTSPLPGAVVNRSVTLQGFAEDPDGDGLQVHVSIDGGPWLSAEGASPWTYAWDTTAYENGERTLKARASDGELTAESATVAVIVENTGVDSPGNDPPLVAITFPVEGGNVSGFISVQGTASDPDGDPVAVEVRIDGGAWRSATGGAEWSFPWDAEVAGAGEHLIEARATDNSLYSEVESVSVIVEAADDPPGGNLGTAPSDPTDAPAPGSVALGLAIALGAVLLRRRR